MTLEMPRPTRTASDSQEMGLVRVGTSSQTHGFIEKVGRVYVSLAGPRYDTAVEVGQSLTLEHARQILVRRAS